METITVNGTPITIPLSIKGSMWAWLVDKPVANVNPYRTLLEYCCNEAGLKLDFDSARISVNKHNSPQEFDKRLIKPTEGFVRIDDSLADDEVLIEGVYWESELSTILKKEPSPVSIKVAEKKVEEKTPVVVPINCFEQYMQAVKNRNK